MADLKISQLTGATTPLAGTEVLPIVQSNMTKKVATDDLTVKNVRSNATTGILQVAGPAAAATRTMTVPDADFTAARIDAAQSFTGDQTLSTGNLIIGTSGKGIDFSATPGTGTSELLADYEEGLCTLGIAFGGGTTDITYGGTPISYVKVGSLVTVVGYIALSNKGSSTGSATITGLPFTTSSSANGGYAAITLSASNLSFIGQYSGYTVPSGTTVNLVQTAETGTLSALTDVNFANNTEIVFCIHYRSV